MAYNDAPTSTAIFAVIVVDVGPFGKNPSSEATLAEKVGGERFDTLSETNLIYGIDAIALIAKMFILRDILPGRNVVDQVDNSNAKGALVMGYSDSPAIDRIIEIF